ncbi:MAG: PAS domain-containing protein, partial [Acholeplasmataceae bacterium]
MWKALDKTERELLERAPIACLTVAFSDEKSARIEHTNRRFEELFGSKDDFRQSEFFNVHLLPHIDRAARTPEPDIRTTIRYCGRAYPTTVRVVSNRYLVYIDRTPYNERSGHIDAPDHLLIDGFVLLIRDRRIVDALINVDACPFKTKDEVIGRTLHDLFPIEQARTFTEAIRHLNDEQQQTVLDYRSHRSAKYYRATFRAHPPYVTMSVKDITEDRIALEQKQREKERYIELGKHARTYAFEVDLSGKYTYVDENVYEILGYRAAEISGKRYFYDTLAPEVRENIKELAFHYFQQHDSIRDLINEKIRKDGKRVTLSTNAYPFYDDQGTLIGYR